MKEWKTGEPRLTVFEASKGAKWFRLSLFGCFFFGGGLGAVVMHQIEKQSSFSDYTNPSSALSVQQRYARHLLLS